MDCKEKNYTVSNDLAKDPTDFTKDGKCSRCGGCCASVLPLGPGDVTRLKDFIEKTGFEPVIPEGTDIVYARCPFLTDGDAPGEKRCAAYDARPDVCRIFSCGNTNYKNAEAWYEAYGLPDMPAPMNAWSLFNLTGLRLGGRPVPYDRAPFCRITNDKNESYEFHVGRPASFMLENGEYVPPGLVVGIYKNGVHVFNDAKHAMEFIPFENVAEVLSDSCRVETMEDRLPGYIKDEGDVYEEGDGRGEKGDGCDG